MNTESFDFEALASQHGTPYYLYDMDQALEHLGRLKAHLPSTVDVIYAIKANPNRAVLEAFHGQIAGLDISSIGELDLAAPAGFGASVMSFAGPGKTDAELRRAIEAEVHLLSVESHHELERLIRLAAELDRCVKVTIRINPLSIPNAFNMKMGGRPSQFGVPEEDVDPTLALASQSERIRLQGIHIYSGTQCLDVDAIIENVEQTLQIGARVAGEHDLHPRVINLGGGFGVPYFPGQQAMDVDELSRRLGESITRFHQGEPRYRDARYILELGRFLIGFFGVYVTRVLDIKETRDKRFVVMDGGMHHCFAATGNFGQLIKKNYVVDNLSRGEAEALKYELVGPLCTPLDSMARAIQIPHAEVGDLLCFRNCGAYCYTASPLLFLGHDTPPELVRAGGEISVARASRPATDFV